MAGLRQELGRELKVMECTCSCLAPFCASAAHRAPIQRPRKQRQECSARPGPRGASSAEPAWLSTSSNFALYSAAAAAASSARPSLAFAARFAGAHSSNTTPAQSQRLLISAHASFRTSSSQQHAENTHSFKRPFSSSEDHKVPEYREILGCLAWSRLACAPILSEAEVRSCLGITRVRRLRVGPSGALTASRTQAAPGFPAAAFAPTCLRGEQET